MRPLRYSINVTLDGCCDHRAIPTDEELHRHAIENLEEAHALLFGRVTYEMMEAAFRPPARTGARPDWAIATDVYALPTRLSFYIGSPAVAWPYCTWYANSRKRANQRLKLTGAAILVFRASTSCRRPRQLSRALDAKKRKRTERRSVLDMVTWILQRLWEVFVERRRATLLVHHAYFGTGAACYFLNLTNRSSKRDLEVTHVWFALEPEIHAHPPDRLLPKRLKPDETWETWVEADRLPSGVGESLFSSDAHGCPQAAS